MDRINTKHSDSSKTTAPVKGCITLVTKIRRQERVNKNLHAIVILSLFKVDNASTFFQHGHYQRSPSVDLIFTHFQTLSPYHKSVSATSKLHFLKLIVTLN